MTTGLLFDEYELKSLVTGKTFKLGKRLLNDNSIIEFSQLDNSISAKCKGLDTPLCTLSVMKLNNRLSAFCNCESSHSFCEHVLAVCLYYLESISAKKTRKNNPLPSQSLASKKKPQTIQAYLGNSKIEDRLGLILELNNEKKMFSFYFFDKQSKKILGESFLLIYDITTIIDLFESEHVKSTLHHFHSRYGKNTFLSTVYSPISSELSKICSLIDHWELYTDIFQQFQIDPNPIDIKLCFYTSKDNVLMKLKWVINQEETIDLFKSTLIDGEQPLLLFDRYIYFLRTPHLTKFASPFLKQPNLTLDIYKYKRFTETKLPTLHKKGLLFSFSPELRNMSFQDYTTEPYFHIKVYNNTIYLKLSFLYNQRKVYYKESQLYLCTNGKNIFCKRNLNKEKRILTLLHNFGFTEKRQLLVNSSDKKFAFYKYASSPRQHRHIFGKKSFEKLNVTKKKIKPLIRFSPKALSYKVQVNISFSFNNTPLTDQALSSQFSDRRKFITFSSDLTAEIQFYKILRPLLALARLNKTNSFDMSLDIGRAAHIYATIPSCCSTTSPNLLSLLSNLIHTKNIAPMRTSDKLETILHPYQKRGVDWLFLLYKKKLGGILADDMGLGKTIQTLALLSKIKKSIQKAPALIVMPTTLLFNWENEIKKFAPFLNVLLYEGPNRHKLLRQFNTVHIIICSYGIVRRDITLFQKIKFHIVILDEAQAIKNPHSKISQAVRKLVAPHRFALSGTPIENRLLEIWSIFQFIMPQYLPSYEKFKQYYDIPSQKGDRLPVKELKQRILPFILRRVKENIALELPKKTESYIYCTLSEEQDSLYRNIIEENKQRLEDHIQKIGINNAQLHIFSLLTKLREICCHPELLQENSPLDASNKLNLLQEMVEQLLQGNHKIVIFSQFVKMLKVMEKWLQKDGIPYELLTGQTYNKKAVIQNFNTDPKIRVFLISLKTGGVGINLTSADYVFHYDPWWNPAVENQASDRVHRIGQEKPTFIYKMLTKSTVEEKIYTIQCRKRELCADMLESSPKKALFLSKDEVSSLLTYTT